MLVWTRVLEALDRHGRAAMVTVVGTRGSAPREAGARLIVHPNGAFTGTIGGGTLEWRAIAIAQKALAGAHARKADRRIFSLGPELGQCCGGQVELVVELIDAAARDLVADFAARETAGPFATRAAITEKGVERHVAGAAVAPPGTAVLRGGVLIEGFGDDSRRVLLFGAGHVGRALVMALAPLPFAVEWVDPRPDAFPAYVPGNVTMSRRDDPAETFVAAGAGTFVLIMSHSHQLDLALVHAALADDRFPYVGLIGSKTKRARFEKRLAASGVPSARIAALVCPIGVDGIRSKAPAIIAAATATELLIRDEALRAAAADGETAAARQGRMNEGAAVAPALKIRPTGTPTLAVAGITKDFATLRANDHIDFTIRPGEIHALLGENGAGKSTLVKIIYGALQPTSGEILWKGKPVRIANPAAARRLGIGMVFQHFSLFDALSVAENISLALADPPAIGALRDKISAVSAEYGLPLNPNSVVADLSVGERQRVEIVRCLLQEPELIIMDEPTSVLTPQEADDLFVTLERLASEQCSILYISHRLEEVKQICHHATILRHGKVVGECDPQKETARRLASLMVGAEVSGVLAPAAPPASAAVRIAVKGLSLPRSHPFGVDLKSLSLEVRAGEIVGIAGIAGNGQDEFFEVLSGERRAANNDAVVLNGVACGRRGVTARRRLGGAFVPEQRLGHGAVPRMRLSENVVLTRHATGDRLLRTGIVDAGSARKIAWRVAQAFDVRKGSPDPEATALSGGNLQKFVVGREIDRKPGVLVVSQPTWGVDAGAATTIRQALVDLAQSGSAILMISQDLDEIFEISDRIAVMAFGHLSKPRAAPEMPRSAIGLMMAGIGMIGAGEEVHAH